MTNNETSVLLPPTKRFVIHSAFLILVSSFLASCGAANTEADGDDKDVRAFLTRYFSTWSARDIDGYADCFHEQARISFVHQGHPRTEGLTDFIHGQKLSHAAASEPMTEVPTDMKILRDERTAQASVRWKLSKGSEITTGTDCFTLIKTPSGWKIMSLVFYND
ncbi:MAG: nuclear transport factor 2 family protein [Prosthecobacter sp.]